MKNMAKLCGIIALVALIVCIAACGSDSPTSPGPGGNTALTPLAGDYTIGELDQEYDGNEKLVTVTANSGKSPGAITVWYEGTGGTVYLKSTTPPSGAGTYAITFDVAAAEGWNAADGLAAGTLTVSLPASGAVMITFSEFGDEVIDYSDDIDTYVRLGDPFTVVVEGEYDNYVWFFNDYRINEDEGINSVVVYPWLYDNTPGTYYLAIIVEKDGVPYSKELTIRVAL